MKKRIANVAGMTISAIATIMLVTLFTLTGVGELAIMALCAAVVVILCAIGMVEDTKVGDRLSQFFGKEDEL